MNRPGSILEAKRLGGGWFGGETSCYDQSLGAKRQGLILEAKRPGAKRLAVGAMVWGRNFLLPLYYKFTQRITTFIMEIGDEFLALYVE